MKFSKTKYLAAPLLLLIFTISGAETVVPLFSNFFNVIAKMELKINSIADTTGGKAGSETDPENKAYLSFSPDDYDLLFKYANRSKTFPPRMCAYDVKVFWRYIRPLQSTFVKTKILF